MENLKKCPCGETPNKLLVMGMERARWAHVSGDCCGDWEIEFRNSYAKIPSDESMALAVEAWNRAKRAT